MIVTASHSPEYPGIPVTIPEHSGIGAREDVATLTRGTLSYMSLEAFVCNQTDADGNIIKCGRPSPIPSLEDQDYKLIFDDNVDELDRAVSRDKIRRAVWNCGENKSPGPDGYTFDFFKKYWSLVGVDFCDAVDYFFKSGTFPRGCNSSLIALIPKVNDAKFVNDFRPISLIGCVYKVITKVLANRLATVISDLVSETQSAFVANRQILDGPFILNEVLNWCKRKRKQAMFFKVDFAKAYDSVRWDYLLDIL
ncbi:RNA-directed DNA polymerase, eukaryota, partial [Tanacetum coccineum]